MSASLTLEVYSREVEAAGRAVEAWKARGDATLQQKTADDLAYYYASRCDELPSLVAATREFFAKQQRLTGEKNAHQDQTGESVLACIETADRSAHIILENIEDVASEEAKDALRMAL